VEIAFPLAVFLIKTASGNAIFTCGFLKKPQVEMLFSLAVLE
jgi:hypothetical protein